MGEATKPFRKTLIETSKPFGTTLIESEKEEDTMKDFMKLILTVGCIAYIISPVDGVPGPVDDFAVLLLTAALNSRKWGNGSKFLK